MKIEVAPAKVEDKLILRNLLELCLHDYSEFNGKDVNEHGLFDYPYLDHYWTEVGRYPFLVKVEGKLAGFVLVRDLAIDRDEPLWQMAEFFYFTEISAAGNWAIGGALGFDRFEGKWEVTQEEENFPARRFWKVISNHPQGKTHFSK